MAYTFARVSAVARLKRGEDFVTIAKAVTEDPSGKQNGGADFPAN